MVAGGSGKLYLYYNIIEGPLKFELKQTIDTGTDYERVATADLNADGNLELITLGHVAGNGVLQVWCASQPGTDAPWHLALAQSTPSQIGSLYYAFAVEDFNDDCLPDIFFVHSRWRSSDERLTQPVVYLENITSLNDITFTPVRDISFQQKDLDFTISDSSQLMFLLHLQSADFNADGNSEVILQKTHFGAEHIRIYADLESAFIRPDSYYRLENLETSYIGKNFTTVDIDADGRLDVVSILKLRDTLRFWRNETPPVGEGTDPCAARRALFIPNVITPNADGKNDAWEIPRLVFYQRRIVRVTDRWGQTVYRSDAYANDWDGHDAAGDPLPAGTYFYEVETESNRHRGWVQILR